MAQMNDIRPTVKGAPDAPSRHPVDDPLPLDLHAECDLHNVPEVTVAEIRAISGFTAS